MIIDFSRFLIHQGKAALKKRVLFVVVWWFRWFFRRGIRGDAADPPVFVDWLEDTRKCQASVYVSQSVSKAQLLKLSLSPSFSLSAALSSLLPLRSAPHSCRETFRSSRFAPTCPQTNRRRIFPAQKQCRPLAGPIRLCFAVCSDRWRDNWTKMIRGVFAQLAKILENKCKATYAIGSELVSTCKTSVFFIVFVTRWGASA